MEYRTTRLFVLATSLLFIALLFLPATLINARQPQTPAPTPTPIGEVEGRGCGSTRVGLQSDQADDGVCDCTLEISQMSSSSFVEGEPGSYQMRLTNVGDMPIDGLTVENNWSNDLQFVSAMGNGWFCQSYGSQTFCDNPSKLMPGSSSTFTMTVGVRPHAPDQIDHCAVLHIEGDNNALNNSSCIETAVERSPSYPIGSTEITVTAGLSATLAYTHPLKALTTQIAIPSGFTSETTLVSYTELLTPTYANALDRTPDVKQFAGRAVYCERSQCGGHLSARLCATATDDGIVAVRPG
ncbi:MAG: hypothetical protein HC837_02630 [Chloroflexaceae bacterium]|nr:hypothetical protein [Chloroflexaceae bacterium]